MKKEIKDIAMMVLKAILITLIAIPVGIPAFIYFIGQELYNRIFGLSKEEHVIFINKIFHDVQKEVFREMDVMLVPIISDNKVYAGHVNPVRDSLINAISNTTMKLFGMFDSIEETNIFYIYLRHTHNYEDATETLLHEMRHHWQYRKYGAKYFADYKEYGEDKKAYRNHPSEIDANKYAKEMMKNERIINIATSAMKEIKNKRAGVVLRAQ